MCPIKEARFRFRESGKQEERARKLVQAGKVCWLVTVLCSETESFWWTGLGMGKKRIVDCGDAAARRQC